MPGQTLEDIRELGSQVNIRLDRLAMYSHRKVLYPIWEMHTLGIFQPIYRLYLQEDEPGRSKERKRGIEKAILLHPFNFDDEEINLDRAEKLLMTMERLPRATSTFEPWWPQDAAALVEAVNKERKEMDTYGLTLGVAGQQKDKYLAPDSTSSAELPLKPKHRRSL